MTSKSITPSTIKYYYHCDEPISTGYHFHMDILGKSWNMCCAGCEVVTAVIVYNGLTNYYKYRTKTAKKYDPMPQQLQALLLYNNQDVQHDVVREKIGIIKKYYFLLMVFLRYMCIVNLKTSIK